MSSYVKAVLDKDERIIHMTTLHWIIFVPGMLLTLLGGMLSLFSYDMVGLLLGKGMVPTIGRFVSGIALFFTLLGFFLLLGALVRHSSTELAITNRRIIAKYGFISRATFEIMINRITGVNFDQTIMGRIFGYGTVLVHGAGGDISPFDEVTDPQIFEEALMGVIKRESKSSLWR